MRPHVGLASLPQRIAGLRSLNQTPPQAAQAAGFADALADQLAPGAPGAAGGAGFAAAGAAGVAPGGFGPGGAYGGGAGVALGQGARFTGVPGLISPQAPGLPGGQGVAAAYGVATSGRTTAGPLVLDRSGPPPELQAYGNGRIPPQALESVGVGDHTLWGPAARAYRDLAAAAARDGVTIGVNDSYRDLAGQHAMVARYGLYSQGGRAASPGSSNHGWGLSIDLDLDARAQAWMRENAAAYGFVEDVPREPWHWTFSASAY